MLRDLMKHGGEDYIEQVLINGAFTFASKRRSGEPFPLSTTPAIDAIIENVIAGMEAGKVNQVSDLYVTLTADERRSMLKSVVKPYNLLKHADRDPLATLDEGDIDPEGAIGHALTAFTMVCPGK